MLHLPVRNEQKLHYAHVDHNQLDPLPFIIIYDIVLFFVCLHKHCDFITNTILVYMLLGGKGCNWLWSTWVESGFRSFLIGQSNIAGCF